MHHKHDNCLDERLGKALSSLRRDLVLPDDFEDKFLQEFHRRRDSVPVIKSDKPTTRLRSFISGLADINAVYKLAAIVIAIIVVTLLVIGSHMGEPSSTVVHADDNQELNRQPVAIEQKTIISTEDETPDNADGESLR